MPKENTKLFIAAVHAVEYLKDLQATTEEPLAMPWPIIQELEEAIEAAVEL